MKKLIVAVLSLHLTGGATADPQRIFEAKKMEPQKILQDRPVYVPVPVPGQMKKLEESTESAAPGPSNDEVSEILDNGRKAATQHPSEGGFFNSITMYPYMEGALYTVYAAQFRATDIRLQPGEKLLGNPVAGDTLRWKLARNVSGSGASRTEHISVSPMQAGISTNLMIHTDKRSYYIELQSFKKSYMASVGWHYNDGQMRNMVADNSIDSSTPVSHAKSSQSDLSQVASLDPASLNFGYNIKNIEGRPNWRPERVFDNGSKTFIHFPENISNYEMPALFIKTEQKNLNVINFRTIGRYFVVDRLFDTAVLRIGEGDDVEEVHVIRGGA